jgi:hypothetical protein
VFLFSDFTERTIPTPNVELVPLTSKKVILKPDESFTSKGLEDEPPTEQAKSRRFRGHQESLGKPAKFYCPRCPFHVSYGLGTTRNRKNARVTAINHYSKSHMPILQSNFLTEGVHEYFQCTLCPFQSIVNKTGPTKTVTRYLAHRSLTRHWLLVHDQLKEDEPGTNEDYSGSKIAKAAAVPSNEQKTLHLKCPRCDLREPYFSGTGASSGPMTRHSAKTKLMYHYIRYHLPLSVDHAPQKSDDGHFFYKCSLCYFQSFINTEIRDGNWSLAKKEAIKSLARHYIARHEIEKPDGEVENRPKRKCRDNFMENKTAIETELDEEQDNFLLRCPQCDFSCGSSTDTDCDEKFKELETHYTFNHLPFRSVLVGSSVEGVGDGLFFKTNAYRCLNCPFTCEVIFEDTQGESGTSPNVTQNELESLRDLAEHYLMIHEDLNSGPLEPNDVKQEEQELEEKVTENDKSVSVKAEPVESNAVQYYDEGDYDEFPPD